jgi:hypothetical protein
MSDKYYEKMIISVPYAAKIARVSEAEGLVIMPLPREIAQVSVHLCGSFQRLTCTRGRLVVHSMTIRTLNYSYRREKV